VQRAVQRRLAVPLSKLMLRHRLDAVRFYHRLLVRNDAF